MRRYDIIRAKDLWDELVDLKEEIEGLEDKLTEDDLTDDEAFNIQIEIKELKDDNRYKALLEVEIELEEMKRDGNTLVPVDDFMEYLKDNYEDIFGEIPDNLIMYIDWEALANDEAQNFTQIEIDGEEYYII